MGEQPKTDPLWYLEGSPGKGRRSWRVPLRSFPFRIGRRPGLDLTLSSEPVSKEHAEIVLDGPGLKIRDLGSTNGTFVNGERLEGEASLEAGDVLHFSDLEFHLGFRRQVDSLFDSTELVDVEETAQEIAASRKLPELIDIGAVRSVVQPILDLADGGLLGYEILGRGRHPGLPESPQTLLRMARARQLELELSQLMRTRHLASCAHLPGESRIFLNASPAELDEPGLLVELARFRKLAPRVRLVLEIHERAVTAPERIRELGRGLESLGVELAYDDFGAGESRLLELSEVPPHYLKFDQSLIRRIDEAVASKRQVLRSLVEMALDLEVVPIAEGIESEEEAEACRALGFLYGQGFLLGRPRPVEELLGSSGTPRGDTMTG